MRPGCLAFITDGTCACTCIGSHSMVRFCIACDRDAGVELTVFLQCTVCFLYLHVLPAAGSGPTARP